MADNTATDEPRGPQWYEGYNAFLTAVRESSNPHPRGKPRRLWFSGYHTAMLDLERNARPKAGESVRSYSRTYQRINL